MSIRILKLVVSELKSEELSNHFVILAYWITECSAIFQRTFVIILKRRTKSPTICFTFIVNMQPYVNHQRLSARYLFCNETCNEKVYCTFFSSVTDFFSRCTTRFATEEKNEVITRHQVSAAFRLSSSDGQAF